MKNPKVLVLRAAGTNCELETAAAFKNVGGAPELVHISELRDGKKRLMDYAVLAIPGGFSYGDDVGAGKVLANQIRHTLTDLRQFVRLGRPVIGICNGFQVLVNLGVLPGLPGRADTRLAALIPNDCGNFRDAWVHLKAMDSKCVFTQGLGHLELPIRHGEGKFYADGPILAELADRGQIALKYAGPSGNVARGRFPQNPNGSLLDIAGITDATGRVLGLMPHPEAHISSFQHPTWTREKEAWRRRGEPYAEQVGAGLAIFQNAVRHLQDQV